MLRHFFQIAIRNLLKRKYYSFINMTGLAIGMASCLLISLFIQHELSFDKFHTKHDRIYRVAQTYKEGKEQTKHATPEEFQIWGCAPVGPALQADFPQVEKVVQFMGAGSFLLEYGNTRIQQENLVCMDSTVFDVFSFKLLKGDQRTALLAPFSIVLTETVAEKFFGKEEPVGKTIKVDNHDEFTVTGVVADPPSNSQISFNGLISMSTARRWRDGIFSNWGYVDFYTYFLLKENSDIQSMEAGIPSFIARNVKGEPGYTIQFEKLDDAYLHSAATRQPGPTGSMMNIYLFACVGFIILLIASVNFMNLSTARSMERAKEVGVRKVLGVQPKMLRWQFLVESVLLSVAAAALAFILARLALPLVSDLSGKPFEASSFFTLKGVVAMVALAILTGLLAGTYPAWFLSKFRPTEVFKGAVKPGRNSIGLRQALVVFQFTLSIVMIAATGIVYAELKYLNQHDLGFRKEQMLILNFEGDGQVQDKIETIKKAIADQPGVMSVAASRAVPGEFLPNAGTSIQVPDGSMQMKIPLIYEIDFDFIPTFNIQLIAGRNYDRQFIADSTHSMIINEAAAKMYGYSNPADAVGRKFSQWGREGNIIGVVKDFNFRSLHTTVEPLTLRYGMPWSLNRIIVQVKGDEIPTTIASIEKIWTKLAPQRPFLYHFLDESFSKQYEADQHFGYLFTLFACLAIFIACLGLFGLSTFSIQQRIKEIGIRKVLGASVPGIVMLVSRDFLRLVCIALVIAVPLCIWIVQYWLDDFAYRVSIGPGVFIITGLIVVAIAFITISWQAIRASFVNPVKCLRSE
ncbi:MAG: ABC transporter permease [Chitinophagaceae bacterium]|nr:ABC transporter permease [Chitinophagaceae bacterium]